MFTFTLKSAALAYYYSFELARDEVFMRFHLHLVKNNGPAGVAGGYLGISTSKNSLITCKQQNFQTEIFWSSASGWCRESPERNELNYPASKNVESELFSYSYDFKQNHE